MRTSSETIEMLRYFSTSLIRGRDHGQLLRFSQCHLTPVHPALMEAHCAGTFASHTSLSQLPDAFLRQLAVILPNHAKLQLRQCCHGLMEAVDATGIKLRLSGNAMTALAISRKHLRALDIRPLQTAAALLPPLLGPPGSYPHLEVLSCHLSQLDLLGAVSTAAGGLLRLKMFGHESTRLRSDGLQQRLPGLTSLTRLEMDVACHKSLTSTEAAANQQQFLWSFLAAQANLQVLALQHSKPHDYSIIDACTINDQCWHAAIQPLAALTRLEMGTRVIGNSNESAADTENASAAVPNLRHLRCFGFDSDGKDIWNLTWVADFVSLTFLDIFFCSAGEVDFEVLSQLQQLCTLCLHYYPDEYITSSQLSPLSACTQLTCLRLGSLWIEKGHRHATESFLPVATAQLTQNTLPSAPDSYHGSIINTGTSLPQLSALQKLVAGVICEAPVATLAPNLRQLRDLDYDLGQLHLSERSIIEHPAAGQEALAGLNELQLLAVNIFALLRHSAYSSLTLLSNLTDLHVEMVGNLTGTHLSPGGLQHLPHLTKLVMTLPMSAKRDLDKTYTTEEDILIWKNQSSLRHMRLRGTMRLGGFLVHDDMLASIPTRLPDLRCIELVNCHDLLEEHLHKLVFSKAARRVVLQGCRNVSARQCMQLQEKAMGTVVVDYVSLHMLMRMPVTV